MKRRQHLDELSLIYNIPVIYLEESTIDRRPDGLASGLCYPDRIELIRFREEDQRAYFAGLHEFGHVKYKHNTFPNRGLIASYRKYENAAEIAAWTWAVRNAHEEPEERTIDDIFYCCYSYDLTDYEIQKIFEEE